MVQTLMVGWRLSGLWCSLTKVHKLCWVCWVEDILRCVAVSFIEPVKQRCRPQRNSLANSQMLAFLKCPPPTSHHISVPDKPEFHSSHESLSLRVGICRRE